MTNVKKYIFFDQLKTKNMMALIEYIFKVLHILNSYDSAVKYVFGNNRNTT